VNLRDAGKRKTNTEKEEDYIPRGREKDNLGVLNERESNGGQKERTRLKQETKD